MNKSKFLWLGGAALLLSSCSNEEQVSASGKQDIAAFTITLPDAIQARAISDGTKANDLHYVVFDGDGNIIAEYLNADAFAYSNTTTVQIRLVYGQTYNVAFWAQNTNAPYSFDNGKITVDYSSANCKANDELRDAFYKVYGPFEFTSTWTPESDILLTRPFAQVNVGTADWDIVTTHNAAPANTGMDFTASVYTSLNLLDGTVADPVNVSFGLNGLPDDDTLVITLQDNSQASYRWIGMNYVLVPPTQELVGTVTFKHDFNNGAVNFTQIPVKRNHRTNIVGNILSSSSDWTVVIDNQFEDPDYNEGAE